MKQQGNISKWSLSFMVLLFWVGSVSFTQAQQFKAEAFTDTNTILIGDQVNLRLIVTQQFDKDVLWPEIGDTITSAIEVVSRTKSDTLKRSGNGTLEIARDYRLTSFDSGYFVIPPLRFTDSKDSSYFKETEAILIEVHTIEVDTAQAIKDIKAPLDVPYTWDEFIPIASVVAGVVLLMVLLYFIYTKIRNRPVKKVEVPVIVRDPNLIALEDLQALEQKKLWQEDKIKQYYTELTDIIRTYIENRFEIIAMEMTTDEIMVSMSYTAVSPTCTEKLHQLLTIADMVKFAKSRPISNEHELSMANAYRFVNDTIQSAPVESVDNPSKSISDVE